MKRTQKGVGRILWALFLCLSLLIGTQSGVWQAEPGTKEINTDNNTNNPFAAMYDSGQLVEQELKKIETSQKQEEGLLQKSIDENTITGFSLDPANNGIIKPGNLLQSISGIDNGENQPSIGQAEPADLERGNPSLLEKIADKQQKEEQLEQLKIENQERLQETKTQLEENYMTDRFIVKYKNTDSASLSEKTAVEQTIELRIKENTLDIDRNITAININLRETTEQNLSDKQTGIDKDTETTGGNKYELLILPEKINPSELAGQLNKPSIKNEIEYIQPDFTLNLEGFESIETSAGTGTETETGLTETETAPTEGNITDNTDSATDSSNEKNSPESNNNTDEPNQSEEGTNNQNNAENNSPLEKETGNQEEENPETNLEQTVEEDEEDKVSQEEKPQPENLTKEPPILLPAETKEEQTIEKPLNENQTEITIAVIDSGIDINHPDLEGYLTEGWNFVENNNELYDPENSGDSNHGTHIAGIIAQTIKGHDAPVKIMPLKIFQNGLAYTSDVIAAIEYAEGHGAAIINCSFGTTSQNPALEEAVKNAKALIIAAAGNRRGDLAETPTYPAAYRYGNIISVGSVNADGGYSYFSNYSPEYVDIAAEGREINSSLPENGHGNMTGTSMAAAQVSAAAAVLAASGLPPVTEIEEENITENQNNYEENTADSNEQEEQQSVNDSPPLETSSDSQENTELAATEESNINIDTTASKNNIGNEPENNILTEPETTSSENQALEFENTENNNIEEENISSSDNIQEETIEQNTETEPQTTEEQESIAETETITEDVAAQENIELSSAYSLREKILNSADRLGNLENKVQQGQRLNLDNALAGISGSPLNLDPADDFDVHGYDPSDSELLRLYTSSGDVVQAVGGESFTVILKENGTVWAWGNNTNGRCGNGTISNSSKINQVIGLHNIIYIATGGSYAFAIDTNNDLWAWGYNGYGVLGDGTTTTRTIPVQINSINSLAKIKAGSTHTIALKTDGTVYSWGYNSDGQLGNGNAANQITPGQISNLTGIIDVSAGYSNSMALTSGGNVYAWGDNFYGQLGNGNTTNSNTPVQVSNLTGAIKIETGQYYNLAIKSDNTLYAWGRNNYGQLGNNSSTNSSSPLQVNNLTGVIDVSSKESHVLALKSDGRVWAWGYNGSGALGNGNTTNRHLPVIVTSLNGVTGIGTGSNHSLAILSDGTVWAWGYNAYLQLGSGSITHKEFPVPITSLNNITSISSGRDHNLALKANGTVWAWGYNDYGQLGDNTTASKYTPAQINNLSGITMIAAGSSHSLALKEDGTVWAWGNNYYGQIGDDTSTNRKTPVQVSNLSGIIAVAAGSSHSIAIKQDGTVWAWGNNMWGQLGDNTSANRKTPVQVSNLSGIIAVAAGSSHSIALKEDGTAWAWGANHSGEIGDGTTTTMRKTPVQVSNLSGIIAVAAGSSHNIALKADGTVWAWGSNFYGQIGDNTTVKKILPTQISALSGVASVAAGLNHSMAANSDGNVYIWGYNGYGPFPSGDNIEDINLVPVLVNRLDDIINVTGGAYHSLALKSNGTVWSWGSNSNGVLGIPWIAISSVPIKCQPEPDDLADEIGSANTVSVMDLPTTITGSINDKYDTDVIKVNFYAGSYSINIESANPNLIVELYDSDQNIVSPGFTKTGDIWSMELALSAPAVYYLMLSYGQNATYSDCPYTVTITGEMAVLPTTLEINCVTGENYLIALTGENIADIEGSALQITYDPEQIQILDLAAQTYLPENSLGEITGTGITVTGLGDGDVQFTLNPDTPDGQAFSGIITILKIQALETTDAAVIHFGQI